MLVREEWGKYYHIGHRGVTCGYGGRVEEVAPSFAPSLTEGGRSGARGGGWCCVLNEAYEKEGVERVGEDVKICEGMRM